ncbi:50S ribosomal protein L25/general stress protein Ctc [Terasakiella sp. A23]|uniref:50S ribosomal protein L25/general stress protein Ctc n=1 Tax=Terasakiella sp. FCG-A23 TaxID=3080561 RepID=UPI0029530BD7|nr:50S ribosomal protein L25/general stress protein Ctc [Terasakiella sp. A23]MDV7338058.1 50S ribosomal protein L25/general stress protein Ctc [Terasakiella sp. A23]
MSYVLTAQKRETAGKGAARAIRREGQVPAVIYGDKKDPVSISISPKELWVQLHTGQTFFASTGEIQIGKSKETVICRDVQFHPVTDQPLHADFLRLGKGASITVSVPVNFINEDQSEGMKRGGVLNVVRHEVEVVCPATAIPESLEVDLAGLAVGDSVHISAVTLPEGVTPTITDRDFTICSVAAPSSGEKAAVEEEGEEGEEEAAAEE